MFPKNRQYSLASLPARFKNQVPQVVGSMVLHIGLLSSAASRKIQLIVKSSRSKHCKFLPEKLKTPPSWSVVAQVDFTRESPFLPIQSGKCYYSSLPIDSQKKKLKRSQFDEVIDDQTADINFSPLFGYQL